MTVTIAFDAFPQPHQGDPIKLTNGTLKIAVPASLLQTGVDAGIIADGMVIPSTLKLILTGDGTTQGSHTYTIHQDAHVVVNNGVAAPLTATVDLPDTTWTPVDDQTPVVFSEKSMTVVSNIDALGGLVATFACTPTGNSTVLGLVAQAGQVITTTTVPVSDLGDGGTTGTTTAPQSADTLPRTGANAALWLVIGAILLDLGLVAIVGTRRRAKNYLRS